MSDPNSEDKWGELAKTIGAEVRPEPDEPVPSSHLPKPRIPASRATVEPPKRATAGWDQLIDEFGLPAPPPEPPKKTAPNIPPPRPRAEAPSPARAKADEPRPPKQRQEEKRPQRTEKPPRGERPERPARPERTERSDKPRRSERTEPPLPRREEQPAARAEQPRDPERELPPKSVTPATPAVAPSVPPTEPTRSGYGLPDWFPFARKRETPAGAPVERRPEPIPPEPTPIEDELDETTLGVETDEAVESRKDTSEEGDLAREKRRRPRRRRRGGKKQSDKSDGPREEAPRPVESVVVDLGPAGHDVELFDDDEEDEETLHGKSSHEDEDDESISSGSSRSANHRNIPTWADAIGVVVDANLATRSERKKTARPSGSNRGGRPRGRRKKGT